MGATYAWLSAELRDWGATDDARLREVVAGIARRVIDEESPPGAPPPVAWPGTAKSRA